MSSLLMQELKEITLEDKSWIQEILNKCYYMSCEYSFGNHFIWKKSYNVKIANINGFYVAASQDENGLSFLYPAGEGDIKPVIEELMEYSKSKGYKFHMHSLPEEKKDELLNLFPGKFKIEENRDLADYIYKSEDLINLKGKKFHGKRNHIARFKENNWSFEPITENNIAECLEMNKKWCVINNCESDESKTEEFCAVTRSLKYFKELNFFGGLLRVDGKVVAFTIAERLNSNTAVVHIEKAFSDIQGAYPMINREFVANMASEYEFINREEDLGVEGLRKAKLSYRPAILLKKYGVSLNED